MSEYTVCPLCNETLRYEGDSTTSVCRHIIKLGPLYSPPPEPSAKPYLGYDGESGESIRARTGAATREDALEMDLLAARKRISEMWERRERIEGGK